MDLAADKLSSYYIVHYKEVFPKWSDLRLFWLIIIRVIVPQS